MSARKRARYKRAKKNRTRKNYAGCQRRVRRASRAISHAQQMQQLQKWLLPDDGIFAGLGLHGNTKWAPTALVWLALCWGWAESKNVTDAFEAARDQCRLLGVTPLSTYQGIHECADHVDRPADGSVVAHPA